MQTIWTLDLDHFTRNEVEVTILWETLIQLKGNLIILP